jgi:hypothetical protein
MIPLNGQRNSQRPQSLQAFDQESLPAPADFDVSALDEAPVDNLPALGPAPSTQLLPSDHPFPQPQSEGAPLERDAANEPTASIGQPLHPSEAVSTHPASRDTQALPSREGAPGVFPSHQDTQAASSGESQPEITAASLAGRQPFPGPENVGQRQAASPEITRQPNRPGNLPDAFPEPLAPVVESPDQQRLAHSVSDKFEERENQIPTVQGKPAVSQPGVTPGENTTPSTPEVSAGQQQASDRPRQSNSISRSANLQSPSGQQYASPPSASQQPGRLEVSPSGISPELVTGNGRTQPQTADISSESTLTDGILQLQRENISSGSALGVQVSQPQPEDISLTPGESARPGDEAKNNHEEMVEPPPAIGPREKASTSSEQGQPLNPGITLQRPGSAMTGQVPAIPGTPSRTSPGRQPAISSESGFQDASPQMSVQSAEQLDESASVQLAPGVEQSGPSRGLGNVALSRLRQSAGQISAQGPSLPSRPGQQWTDTGENPQSSGPELPNSLEALVPREAVAAISADPTKPLEEKAVNAVNKERATGSPSIPPQDTNNPMPAGQRSNVQPGVIQRQVAPAGSSPTGEAGAFATSRHD